MSGDSIMVACFLGMILSAFGGFIACWALRVRYAVLCGSLFFICVLVGFYGQEKSQDAFDRSCKRSGGVVLRAKYMEKCVRGVDLTDQMR